MGREHMDAHLKVTLLAAVKMPRSESKPHQQGVAPFEECEAEGGHHRGDTYRLHDVPAPVEVVLNILPTEIHPRLTAHRD